MRGAARASRRCGPTGKHGAVALLAALPLLGGWSFFDPFHENVEKGNKLAEGEQADAALERYGEAARLDPGSPIPDFNRGIVLSGQGKAQEAGDAFLGAAAAEDPQVAADALYNLGNVLLEAQQYEPAVEAYLSSLDLDPDDADARRNLEIAWKRLEQQQQEQQQEQDQDQQSQDQQEQDQQEQDQQQQDQQQQDQQQQDQRQQDQQQQQQDPQQQQQQQRQATEQPGIPAEVERALDALQDGEQNLERLRALRRGRARRVEKDW
jgi:tetratricopeptide (TPR) repeat protein